MGLPSSAAIPRSMRARNAYSPRLKASCHASAGRAECRSYDARRAMIRRRRSCFYRPACIGKSQPINIFAPRGGPALLSPDVARGQGENPSRPGSRRGRGRAAWVRAAIRTKALRMIFAGRAGSTPAVTTLLTANNRNVFIMFPPDCVTDSSVMYTAMLGINVYSSSRNFKLFFGSCFLLEAPRRSGRFDRGPGPTLSPNEIHPHPHSRLGRGGPLGSERPLRRRR